MLEDSKRQLHESLAAMRSILLIVLLISTHVELQAQPMPRLPTYSQADTLRAIEHLFTTKRTGGKIYMGVGLPLTLVGATTAFLATTVTTTIKAGEGKEKALPIILASGGIGLVLSSIGLSRRIRYSRRREQTILTAYQTKKPLPRWVQRRLRPTFFW